MASDETIRQLDLETVHEGYQRGGIYSDTARGYLLDDTGNNLAASLKETAASSDRKTKALEENTEALNRHTNALIGVGGMGAGGLD